MLIGYTDDLNDTVKSKFSDSGLIHIMSVSGANVAFIVFPLMFIFKRAKINKKISTSIIMATLIIFLFITGFQPSVVRAIIMAIVILLGNLILKESDVLTTISIAAIIMLIANPYTLFDIGFQLSFAATISIVVFYSTIKKFISTKFIPNTIVDVIATTIAAQIGVIPIIAYYFNKISVLSLLSNIFVVPITGFVTIAGIVMVILGSLNIFLAPNYRLY
jgi:competence protein ComEC